MTSRFNPDDIPKTKIDEENCAKLAKITHPRVRLLVAKISTLCNPERIFVSDDSQEDIARIKQAALENGEEIISAVPRHTVHWDGYFDQGRDKENTKILVPRGTDLGPDIATKDRSDGLREIKNILMNIMAGRTLYVAFFSLGPIGSKFSIPCVQLTDSAFVIHNEYLLCRPNYEEFIELGQKDYFFAFLHGQGELDERGNSKNLAARRIFIDLQNKTVYSVNTQYGGNSMGLKKLAMRLAIKLAAKDGWLTEHMLLMGIKGPNNRTTYFAGAFPSLCGKTSTAMMDGESIIGDDIAFLRRKKEKIMAVNAEKGMFGIVKGISSKDDPALCGILNDPAEEIIFSNVLLTTDGTIHWTDKDGETPARGMNHSGAWSQDKKDNNGKLTPPSHPNARFTLGLKNLPNLDENLENPDGVNISAIVYGGRDPDTSVPVEESFDWIHGIITKGAGLESETTAAALGQEGIREINPMSNLDFLPVSIGKYIQMNLNFGANLKNTPLIFGVNYFLRDKNGNSLNGKTDKRVWYKWMELRVHAEVKALDTPTGRIPLYADLRKLFSEVLGQEYSWKEYLDQFTLRIPENLLKIGRIVVFYRTRVTGAPAVLFEVLEAQKTRLLQCQEKYGDYVLPYKFYPE